MAVPPDLLGAPFRAASAARKARVFHPDGVVVRGELEVAGAGLLGSDLLRPGRRAPAVVRLSRGLGLPEPLPDVLGLALKVPGTDDGVDGDQDVLLVTVARPGPLRRLLVPARSFAARPYASLLPYETGGRRHLLGATVEVDGDDPRRLADVAAAATGHRLRITFLTGDRLGRTWRPVATVAAHDVVPDAEGRALAFDPWHTGGGIRPAGLLNRTRRAAYPASRRGRAGR